MLGLAIIAAGTLAGIIFGAVHALDEGGPFLERAFLLVVAPLSWGAMCAMVSTLLVGLLYVAGVPL